jgi:integrase
MLAVLKSTTSFDSKSTTSFAGEQRLLVALVLAACTIARKAEVANLKVQDVRPGQTLRLEIARAKGGRAAVREAPTPDWLWPLIPELVRYLNARERNSRLIQPLASRSASADAIFGRIAYRLDALGIDWSPHLMRTIAATEANAAGEDRAVISHRLGHVLVKTASTNYVALNLKQLRASADRHAAFYPTKLSAPAIAFLFGISERQAKAIHARTQGSFEKLSPICAART